MAFEHAACLPNLMEAWPYQIKTGWFRRGCVRRRILAGNGGKDQD